MILSFVISIILLALSVLILVIESEFRIWAAGNEIEG